MKEIILSPRLKMIASLIPAGAHLADVGTDHGYLPIALLKSGRIASAVASDLRSGPLSRAKQHAEDAGVLLECVLSDGLKSIRPEEVDTIVIAGMGGDNILKILSDSPWSREVPTVIVQPMTKADVLRRALPAIGMKIVSERLVEEPGHLYSVIELAKGKPDSYSELEYHIGLFEHISGEPLFPVLLDSFEKNLTNSISLIGESVGERSVSRIAELKGLLMELNMMKGKKYG